MATGKKPLVVVTRRLPDSVEMRMRELFDARLNADDKPMSQAQLVEAAKTADVIVPTVTDHIDRAVLSQSGETAEADRQFRQRRRQYRRRDRRPARHHRDQYAGRPHRGHRRHDHGADPGGAAAFGRGRAGAHRRSRMERLEPDLDARPSHLGQAARHRRHGPDRPGGGAPRPCFRIEDPLLRSPPRRVAISKKNCTRPIGRASTRCSPAWTSSRSIVRIRRRPIICSRRGGSSSSAPRPISSTPRAAR